MQKLIPYYLLQLWRYRILPAVPLLCGLLAWASAYFAHQLWIPLSERSTLIAVICGFPLVLMGILLWFPERNEWCFYHSACFALTRVIAAKTVALLITGISGILVILGIVHLYTLPVLFAVFTYLSAVLALSLAVGLRLTLKLRRDILETITPQYLLLVLFATGVLLTLPALLFRYPFLNLLLSLVGLGYHMYTLPSLKLKPLDK